MIATRFFHPGEDCDIAPEMLSRVEGDRSSIVTPNGSAHILKSLVDTHPALLRSLVLAARDEWLEWREEAKECEPC